MCIKSKNNQSLITLGFAIFLYYLEIWKKLTEMKNCNKHLSITANQNNCISSRRNHQKIDSQQNQLNGILKVPGSLSNNISSEVTRRECKKLLFSSQGRSRRVRVDFIFIILLFSSILLIDWVGSLKGFTVIFIHKNWRSFRGLNLECILRNSN